MFFTFGMNCPYCGTYSFVHCDFKKGNYFHICSIDINYLKRTGQTIKSEFIKLLAMNILVAHYTKIPFVNTSTPFIDHLNLLTFTNAFFILITSINYSISLK